MVSMNVIVFAGIGDESCDGGRRGRGREEVRRGFDLLMKTM